MLISRQFLQFKSTLDSNVWIIFQHIAIGKKPILKNLLEVQCEYFPTNIHWQFISNLVLVTWYISPILANFNIWDALHPAINTDPYYKKCSHCFCGGRTLHYLWMAYFSLCAHPPCSSNCPSRPISRPVSIWKNINHFLFGNTTSWKGWPASKWSEQCILKNTRILSY